MTARTIAMMNQKGGVGKTTTTVNLGAAVAQSGKRVLLVDLDPQAHLTLHLGIDPGELNTTVYDLLLDAECSAADVIVDRTGNGPSVTSDNAAKRVEDDETRGDTSRKSGAAGSILHVIPAEVDLAAAENELGDVGPTRNLVLRRKLAAVSDQYDLILFDCPPGLGLLTINALAAAGEVVIPMQPHFLALQGVGKLLETVGRVCASVNPDLRVSGIVVCMHESQTTLAREVVNDLDQFFDQHRDKDVPWRTCRVLQPAIRRNIKVAEAPSFGQTIFEYSPWCPGAIDYRRLAEGLMASWSEQSRPKSDSAASGSAKPTAGSSGPKPVTTPQHATIEVKHPPAHPPGGSGAASTDGQKSESSQSVDECAGGHDRT